MFAALSEQMTIDICPFIYTKLILLKSNNLFEQANVPNHSFATTYPNILVASRPFHILSVDIIMYWL